MNTPPRVDTRALRAEIKGGIVASDDPAWDAARQAWNLVADQRPALVVQPADADDVAATVRFASAAGLRVAPQSFGHGAVCLDDLDGAILLRTTGMTDVSIDLERRTATVSAGASWRDVIGPAAEHGLVGLHGMSAGVGVIGYALGGGIGWLSRLHGLASDPHQVARGRDRRRASRATSTPTASPSCSGRCAAAAAARRS